MTMSSNDLADEGPFDAVLYPATTVSSPLGITIQLECCRTWMVGSRLRATGAFLTIQGAEPVWANARDLRLSSELCEVELRSW